MWVIQNGALLSVPDDAPLPPHSVTVELPDDFRDNPSMYSIEAARIVRRKSPEKRRGPKQPRLTQEDVVKIKKAIARGDIK